MLDDVQSYAIKVASEIYNAWPIILIAAFGAIIFTYVWSLLLQLFAAAFVWITIITAKYDRLTEPSVNCNNGHLGPILAKSICISELIDLRCLYFVFG
jgi:hypothetical protein